MIFNSAIFLLTRTAVHNEHDVVLAQYQLSRGLHKLFMIFMSYDNKSNDFLTGNDDILYHYDFLARTFTLSAPYGSRPLCDLTDEEQENFIAPPVIDDSDSGPEDVWRWAHQEEDSHNFRYSQRQASLRRWAYVMWDRQRLDAWSVMDKEWQQDLPLSHHIPMPKDWDILHHVDFDDIRLYRDLDSQRKLIQDEIKLNKPRSRREIIGCGKGLCLCEL